MKKAGLFGLLAIAVAVALTLAFMLPRDQKVLAGNPVVLRLQSFALSLHPLKMADVESRQVASLLYAGLVAQEQGGNTRPMIAANWTKSGNEWRFTLRPDIAFTNGQPVTAADVVTSLCNAMQPTSPWAWSLTSIAHVDSPDGKTRECTGISAHDEGQVIIIESKPVPWFLDAISGPAGWILPAGGAKEEAYGVMPGAGSFSIVEVVPDVRVMMEARTIGRPVNEIAPIVRFDYLPDETTAAKQFASRKLDILDLTSPQLVDLLIDPGTSKLKYPGSITERPWDRIRVVIINKKALSAKGFNEQQARDFIDMFSAKVDREKLANLSRGIGIPLVSPFPPAQDVPELKSFRDVGNHSFPETRLVILTEPDPYSDLIAANLPKQVGQVKVDYKGVDKGILIDSLLKGEFEIVSILIEATVHSPEFWKAFFMPGNPLNVVGTPIPGMDTVDVTTESGVAEAGRMIARQGNWIALLQEKRLQAVAPGVTGISFSPSGQTNFAFIKRN